METRSLDNLKIFFAASEREAAELIGAAAEKSARLIREHWGLAMPPGVRLYVMTSWLAPMFHAASWPWKILMGIKLPLWAGALGVSGGSPAVGHSHWDGGGWSA